MGGRAANKLISLTGGFRLNPLTRNQFVACFAILGLYLQLAAGMFCTAGLPSSANFAGFPICHAPSGDPSPGSTHHAPAQQQQSCPFCALHCHAALILPLALIFADPSTIVAVLRAPQYAAQPRLRFSIAAQPRGPPLFS
jgi:Protein of unknown function (DUF2946)